MLKKIGIIILIILTIAVIIIPIIFMVYTLNKSGKKLVIYPEMKIESVVNNKDVSTSVLKDSMEVTTGVLIKMGLK
jgi:hypothetical protein